MTLIKSISGFRGTIGGKPGDTLNPLDIVKFVSSYATLRRQAVKAGANKIVVGRDARISGPMVSKVVCGTLLGLGYDVVDIGLASTPTTELAAEVVKVADIGDFSYADVDHLGKYKADSSYNQKHIDLVKSLELVDVEAIRKANFRVALDTVNSVGGVILPELLKQLGVETVNGLYLEPTGDFKHNPEPLEKNLGDIMSLMSKGGYDVGFVVDPDVDRLALIDERGKMYGEEYTLVTVADYVLQNTSGNTVSNLSSTRALRDVTEKYGCKYTPSAVGEVNVVTKMKEVGAVIGGEGNGGVIYPAAHYGRDALVGIALLLTYFAKLGKRISEIRNMYPHYEMAKNRIDLKEGCNPDAILAKMKEKYQGDNVTTIDGVKIDFEDKWVHLRKSNTEPIIRVYSEAHTAKEAQDLGERFVKEIESLC